jgi:hypothetical protein
MQVVVEVEAQVLHQLTVQTVVQVEADMVVVHQVIQVLQQVQQVHQIEVQVVEVVPVRLQVGHCLQVKVVPVVLVLLLLSFN